MNLSLQLMAPEIIVLATGFLILISDLFQKSKNENKASSILAIVGIILAACSGLFLTDTPTETLGGRFGLDQLDLILKEILLLSAGLVVMISPAAIQNKSEQRITHLPEFFTVILFTLSGMMFLVSSRDLVTLYVSLELATIPLFALTAWTKTDKSGEAGVKYLIMGAIGSAFLLYGLGFIYSITGDLGLKAIQTTLTANQLTNPSLYLAGALILAGVGFKLTLIPFHMWAPDAYQGAPTPITAFLSVASKGTGLVLAIQLFFKVMGFLLQPFVLGIAILATLTMTLGNLVAVRQNNLKRFMAYSSISQAGYLLMGFMTLKPEGLTSMVFYMLVYALTNLAAFGVLIVHIHQTGQEDITSLRGISKANPLLALSLMIALFGLAGIPPLAGFVGKFFLFSVAAQVGYYWLVAVAALNSTVSLYYYLRLVRQMYIEQESQPSQKLELSPMSILGIGIATVGSVVAGLIPYIYDGILATSSQWLQVWLKI